MGKDWEWWGGIAPGADLVPFLSFIKGGLYEHLSAQVDNTHPLLTTTNTFNNSSKIVSGRQREPN